MAGTSIQIQPAPGPGPAPSPKSMGMISVSDGAGGIILLQQVVLTDDQGNTYSPLTEATGMKILSILAKIHNQLADANNSFRVNERLDPQDV